MDRERTSRRRMRPSSGSLSLASMSRGSSGSTEFLFSLAFSEFSLFLGRQQKRERGEGRAADRRKSNKRFPHILSTSIKTRPPPSCSCPWTASLSTTSTPCPAAARRASPSSATRLSPPSAARRTSPRRRTPSSCTRATAWESPCRSWSGTSGGSWSPTPPPTSRCGRSRVSGMAKDVC